MPAHQSTPSDKSLARLLTSTNLDRESFVTLFLCYAIIFSSLAYCYAQSSHTVTDYPMLYGPHILFVIFFTEILYQRSRSFLASTTGFISFMLGFCIGALALVFGAWLLQQYFPSVAVYQYVSIAAYGAMFAHAYLARMRNLNASVGFMLSPLAILPIPYVLYALLCKYTFVD